MEPNAQATSTAQSTASGSLTTPEIFSQPIQSTGEVAKPGQSVSFASNDGGKAKENKVYILGDKRFDNPDDLASYAAKLQEESSQFRTIREQLSPQQTTPKQKISDVLFEDPDAAVEMITKQVRASIDQEAHQQRTAQQVVQTFFEKNADLKQYEDLCDYYAAKMQNELASLPMEDRYSKVAQAVRSRLASIKGATGSTEELSSKPAVTLGASSGQPVSGATVSAPKSFADQIAQFQRRGKK